MPRSRAAALTWLNTRIGTRGWRRRCLEIVRLAWGYSPSGIPTAYAGWDRTKHRHRRDYNPPAGAPCWFRGPTKAGHVATATGDGDEVIGNDYPTSDRMNRSTIRAIEKGWDCEYLGWTEDYPGQGKLPLANSGGGGGGGSKPSGYKPDARAIYVDILRNADDRKPKNSDSVYWWQRILNAVSFPDGKEIKASGDWSAETTAETKKAQKSIGDTQDGWPGPKQIEHFAEKAKGEVGSISIYRDSDSGGLIHKT